jgi:hypothetical protein
MRRQNIVLLTQALRLLSILASATAVIVVVSIAVQDTLHRKGLEGDLEGIELRAKRSVEEFGTDPDADAAEKGRIDPGLDLGSLAEGGPERLGVMLPVGGMHPVTKACDIGDRGNGGTNER